MRTLVRWIVVTFGIAALVRWLRSRKAAPEPAETLEAPSAVEDPAEELRRKLAESRGEAGDAESAPEPTLEERRADVHAQGRAVLEEMTPPDEG